MYVNSNGKELTHLSTRLRPSITMEILSEMQDRGSSEASKVFKQVKKSIQERFHKSEKTAQWLSKYIYNSERSTKAQITQGIILRNKSPLLLTKSKKVYRPINSLDEGCFRTAEIVIGFDAGTNGNLYYGTSAFVILANGQSLGWELPEAQPGEKISSAAIIRTVTNIISRFQKIENRLPRRILMLRDGIVQCEEFEDVVAELLQSKIAVDLLGVRKSGAGRMAILPYQSESLTDASPGTAILSNDDKTFHIVTSEAKAGGSTRPLKVVRDFGDAPLEILAKQIDRLSMFNPASALAYSRLPYVIHVADKMAKSVQRLGELGILHGINRQKIFFI